jgi:ankyrin repeat protein
VKREIINLLLAKEDIDINLFHGTAPIIAATRRGLVEVVESLVARENLNPNAFDTKESYSALGCAADGGLVDIMKLLLNRPDVDPNSVAGYDLSTALIVGVRHPDVIKLLLDQEGIDIDYQDRYGVTALKAAWCNLESAKLLLERHDINENNLRENGQIFMTPLHVALWRLELRGPEWRETTLGYRRL